jgi:hypothetical protein
MTNPNPSPELQPCPNPWCSGSDPVVERTLRYMGDDSPRRVDCQCGQLGPVKPTETEAIAAWNTRATLSQTPPTPSLSTDVQSAATGFHEHDVSLKVAMPAPGEIEATVAETVTVALPVPGEEWTRTQAFDEAAAECLRAAQESKFADTVNEDERKGYRTACNLMAMSFRVMASRAAPDWPTPATVAAGDGEGVAEQALKKAAEEFDLILMRLRDDQPERAAGAAICGAKDARAAIRLLSQGSSSVHAEKPLATSRSQHEGASS